MDVYGRTPDQIKRSLDDIGCCTQCELFGYTHDRPYGCPDNEKNICAKDDALRLIEKYEEVIESRSHEPTREQLANLFSYMHRLSQLISPADAKRFFGFSFGEEISAMFCGLAVMYEKGEKFEDFLRDESYGPAFHQAMNDINKLLNGVD